MTTWGITKIVLVIGVLFFTGLFWWLPDTLVAPAINMTVGERRAPDYYIDRFTVTAMDVSGLPKYTLQARNLVHFPKEEMSRLDEPTLIQYLESESGRRSEVPVTTTADLGYISGDGKRLLMSGNVVVRRGREGDFVGGEIETNQLNVVLH